MSTSSIKLASMVGVGVANGVSTLNSSAQVLNTQLPGLAASLKGCVTLPATPAGKVLDDAGNWVAQATGSGDVTGPSASTPNAIARFSGALGKTIQDYTSGAPTVSDTGFLSVNGAAYVTSPGTPTGPDLLHLYGAGTTGNAAYDLMMNNLVVDGAAAGDKGFVWCDAGTPKFQDYMWRSEGGKFRYVYNFESQRDLQVLATDGRMGICKQSDVVQYHSLWANPNLGRLNDVDTGGLFTKTYDVQYEISIHDLLSSLASKMVGGQSGNGGWSASNWVVLGGNAGLQHTVGFVNNTYLVASAYEAGSVTTGVQVRIAFTVSGMSAGTVTPFVGAATGTVISSNGVYSVTIEALANDPHIGFTPTSAFNGVISNISFLKLESGVEAFRWRKTVDYGTTFSAYSAATAITAGVPQLIENGFTVTFANGSGHNGSDVWLKYAYGQMPQGSLTISSIMFTEALYTTDYTAGTVAYTDYSFNMASSLPADDLTLLASTTGAIYVGLESTFPSAAFALSTAALGLTLITEYWTGVTWVQMIAGPHDYFDGTVNMTINGRARWDASLLTGWAKTYLPNKVETGYELYWVRFRTSSTPSTAPVVTTIDPHANYRLAVYASALNPVPSMAVDNAGRVIIGGKGVTYGNVKLHVISTYNTTPDISDGNALAVFDSDSSNARNVTLKVYNSTGGIYPTFQLARARGTITAPATIAAYDTLGGYWFKGRLGSVWRDLGAYVCKHDSAVVERTARMQIYLTREGFNSNNPASRLEIATGADGIGTLQFFSDTTANGVAVNEFSNDTTMAGNSDLAVPTEKAVKTYVDTALLGKTSAPGSTAKNENSDGTVGDLNYNGNYVYLCVTTGTGGAGRWVRFITESTGF